jgi:hypothetical protein
VQQGILVSKAFNIEEPQRDTHLTLEVSKTSRRMRVLRLIIGI